MAFYQLIEVIQKITKSISGHGKGGQLKRRHWQRSEAIHQREQHLNRLEARAVLDGVTPPGRRHSE